MKVFIAVEFEEHVKNYLYEQQQQLKKFCIGANFSRRENFHLTLRYIGDVDDNQVERLRMAVDETCKAKSGFNIELGKIGAFARGRKNILWLGISRGKSQLMELFQQLEHHIEKSGFAKEDRPLSPHITLAREAVLREELDELTKKIHTVPIETEVNSISLMESKRENGLLVYRPIYVRKLK